MEVRVVYSHYLGALDLKVTFVFSTADPYVDIFLTTGPEGALTNWENQDSENVKEDLGYYLFDDDVPPFFAGYYERAFAKVWERRKHDPLFAQPKQKAPLFIPDVDEEEDGQDGGKAGEKEEEKEPKPLQPPTENDGGSPSRWLLDEVLGANDTCACLLNHLILVTVSFHYGGPEVFD